MPSPLGGGQIGIANPMGFGPMATPPILTTNLLAISLISLDLLGVLTSSFAPLKSAAIMIL